MSIKTLIFAALVGTFAISATASAAPANSDDLHFYSYGPKVPFSAAVRTGRTLYLSGQIGMAPNHKLPASFEGQAKQVMENIKGTLAGMHLGMDRVVKCTVMLDDMNNWPTFNKVYMSFFKPDHMPARSASAVKALALGAALEVECIAYLPKGYK
ncbi:RidA family protein [Gallaecimonas mangrovi]|uniref:RidA family protein n=1 Tax=Gallaecimonas mangrovi TaxID=2291597 RepID=UPI000E2019F6|nr:RidA family protein [Gallaecimonas mangrovi]